MKYSWINIVKGIGIILVVLGHTYGSFAHDLIFLVHMPLFFFISGYLFSTQNPKKYFLKKSISLLIPYFTFLLILYPFEYPYSENMSLFKYIVKLLYGGLFLNKSLLAFWFVTCLFLTQQVFNFIAYRIKSEVTLGFIAFSLLMASYINSEFYSDFWLPWNANVVLAAFPIFYLGYLFKKYNQSLNIIFLSIFMIGVSFITYYKGIVAYDMKVVNYGIPLLTLFLSLIFILFIISISKKIQNIKFASILLEYFGNKSIIILFLHQPILMYLNNNFDIPLFVIFLISISGSCIFYHIFDATKLTRIIFLGSKKDLDSLKKE